LNKDLDKFNKDISGKMMGKLDPSGKMMGKLKLGKMGKLLSMGSSIGPIFEFIKKIIYRYLFELIILITLLHSMITYGKNIDDVELKTGLISLNFAILLLVISYIYHKYTQLNKMMHSEHSDG
jgi:hypothetical protein